MVAHAVNNLGLGDELENEGYESDKKTQALLQDESGFYNVTSPREDAQDHDTFIWLTGTL